MGTQTPGPGRTYLRRLAERGAVPARRRQAVRLPRPGRRAGRAHPRLADAGARSGRRTIGELKLKMYRGLCLLLLALSAAARADSDAPFLWQVVGPHATHYLLGSVHL